MLCEFHLDQINILGERRRYVNSQITSGFSRPFYITVKNAQNHNIF